ncbi:hypothetical protein [uncultured Vibrio sp.]|uniref:hypothetical protein n=1 Tax=uncultured Vibrio sp. TaxID=114054 RepID=UPI002639B4CE|nr:hypothetical protein [uncultured Vibrio sp.]
MKNIALTLALLSASQVALANTAGCDSVGEKQVNKVISMQLNNSTANAGDNYVTFWDDQNKFYTQYHSFQDWRGQVAYKFIQQSHLTGEPLYFNCRSTGASARVDRIGVGPRIK